MDYACVNSWPFLPSNHDEPAAFEHGTPGRFGVAEMTTLNTDLNTDHAKPVSAEASQATQAPVEQSAAPAALITEQQVMFGSAAALAPAPAKTHFWSRAAHAVFTSKGALFGLLKHALPSV